jgi:hypothetical protein
MVEVNVEMSSALGYNENSLDPEITINSKGENENDRIIGGKKRTLSDEDDDDDDDNDEDDDAENGCEDGRTNELGISQQSTYSKLRYCIVENDNTPDSCVKLIGLKSLFAKQLPKMPKAYIARLVFDRRHKSLMILSDDPQYKGTDEEIIGAICYRGFYEMRFAEIAFCAVSSSHQVKVRMENFTLFRYVDTISLSSGRVTVQN